MSEQSVKLQVSAKGVATVTLDRPEKHNAFDDGMIAELRQIFDQLAGREDVRVMVLASSGKSFSAGADLGWMQRMAEYDFGHNMKDAEQLAGMLQALFQLPQPTVARVQGAAFGGAVGLVSCCDMAIGADEASFALSEVRIGLIPATISPYVIRAIGERAARRYVMTGERFTAATARELGLLSETCPGEQLDERVDALVAVLLGNGPAAIRAAKDLITGVSGQDLSADLIEDTCARIAHIRVSEEGQEGLAAFLQKRPPAWQVEED